MDGYMHSNAPEHPHKQTHKQTHTNLDNIQISAQKLLTKGNRKIAVSRKPLIIPWEVFASKRLLAIFVCVCVPVCFQRDALKMLPTASPCFIKGSETQHTEKKH